jgi:hypothetical protein
MGTLLRRARCAPLFIVLACGSGKAAANRVAEPLDPADYRPHLVLLDAMIFDDGPIGNEAQLMLLESVGRFARDLELEGDRAETAKLLNQELGSLAGTVQEATGKSMEDSGIREAWLRIRDRFFQDADWFRDSPADPVADMGRMPRMGDDGRMLADVPGMDTLAGVFTTLMVITEAAERDLGGSRAATPAREQMLALLTGQLAHVDSLLAARSDYAGDEHFQYAWTNAREASRQIKLFLASDADTLTGSAGRKALEEAVTQLEAGMAELEKIGS